MRIRLCLSMFCLTLFLAQPSLAENARLGNRGEVIPVSELATITQKAEEDKEAFLARVGGWMHNYTSGTNEEVCANICAAPAGQLSVRVMTNHSHLACALVDRCTAGASLTSDTIHSHPVTERFVINDADRAFMRDRSPSIKVDRRSRFTGDSEGFSSHDYVAGPGYLVAKGRLLYQSGVGTARVVRESVVPPPLDDAAVATLNP